ncbi:MAG: hypothetical protein MI717_02945 [Spirochaetales bacterium]|nr:hypothetical protein [Spirochaetales bacterium]
MNTLPTSGLLLRALHVIATSPSNPFEDELRGALTRSNMAPAFRHHSCWKEIPPSEVSQPRSWPRPIPAQVEGPPPLPVPRHHALKRVASDSLSPPPQGKIGA